MLNNPDYLLQNSTINISATYYITAQFLYNVMCRNAQLEDIQQWQLAGIVKLCHQIINVKISLKQLMKILKKSQHSKHFS